MRDLIRLKNQWLTSATPNVFLCIHILEETREKKRKKKMPQNGSVANGRAESPAQVAIPPIVGINFGNSYASIAVFTKVRPAT